MEKVEMEPNQPEERMSSKTLRTSVMLAVLIIVATVAALYASVTFFPFRNPFQPHPALTDVIFYTANAIVSTVNVMLSLFLLATYVGIYRKTRSEFTIMLTIFSAVFLLNALVSNPFVIRAFGFVLFGFEPSQLLPQVFTLFLLPQIFTLAALAVLLYLSLRY